MSIGPFILDITVRDSPELHSLAWLLLQFVSLTTPHLYEPGICFPVDRGLSARVS